MNCQVIEVYIYFDIIFDSEFILFIDVVGLFILEEVYIIIEIGWVGIVRGGKIGGCS